MKRIACFAALTFGAGLPSAAIAQDAVPGGWSSRVIHRELGGISTAATNSWAGPGAVRGARVLDAFAGTGALGLEALSRGAVHATFIERDRAALAALRANVAVVGTAAEVLNADARRPPPGRLRRPRPAR